MMLKILVGLLIALAAYATATTWWILQEPDRIQLAEQRVRTANSNIQHEVFNAGETARAEVHNAFFPLKEQLRNSPDMLHCLGVFDDRVQAVLDQATAFANHAGGLPPTNDPTSATSTSSERGGVASKRTAVGSGNP